MSAVLALLCCGSAVAQQAPPDEADIAPVRTLLDWVRSTEGSYRLRLLRAALVEIAKHALRGHSPRNAREWRALDEALADPNLAGKEELLFKQRARLLVAAAYLVDGGRENIETAQAVLEAVLRRADTHKKLKARARALLAVARCLKPVGDGEVRSAPAIAWQRDATGLLKAVADLYGPGARGSPLEIVRRARKAIAHLVPPASAPASAPSPGSWERHRPEGVAAYALDRFLGALEAVLDEPGELGVGALARHLARIERYRLPPVLRRPLAEAVSRRRARIARAVDRAFRKWLEDPYRADGFGKVLPPRADDVGGLLGYYRVIYHAWATDRLYRASRRNPDRWRRYLAAYARRMQALRRKGRWAPAAGGGPSRLERYVSAMLALYGSPPSASELAALRKGGRALADPLDRAVEFHLLARDLECGPADDAGFWKLRCARAAALHLTTALGGGPDVHCGYAYGKLCSALAERLRAASGGKVVVAVGRKGLAGLQQSLSVVHRFAGELPADVLVGVLACSVRRDEFMADPAVRKLLHDLDRIARSRAAGALLARAEAAHVEFIVREEVVRLCWGGVGPAGAESVAAIKAVLADTAGRWGPELHGLARLAHLANLIEAGRYREALALVVGGPLKFAALPLSPEERRRALAGRLERLVRHFLEGGGAPVVAAERVARARALLAVAELPLEAEVLRRLRLRVFRRLQTLRARAVNAAPRGKAFEVFRLPVFRVEGPPVAGLDAAGRAEWAKAVRRLVEEASRPEDFAALAGVGFVELPWESLARKAMALAEGELAAGRVDRAVEFVQGAEQLLRRCRAGVADERFWFAAYARLAADRAFDERRRRQWRQRAMRFVGGDTAQEPHRRLKRYYLLGEYARCRSMIKALPTSAKGADGRLLVLAAACRLQELWPAVESVKSLATALAKWWSGFRPAGGDLSSALSAVRPRDAGTRARRAMLLAVLHLGGAERPARPTEAVLRGLREARRSATTSRPWSAGPFESLVGDEPVQAAGLEALLHLRLARGRRGPGRVAAMAVPARLLLPETVGGDRRRYYLDRYLALPPLLRAAAAESAYEGRLWLRSAVAYRVELAGLKAKAALDGRDLETVRRWLQSEVLRRCGREEGRVVPTLRAVVRQGPSWLRDKPFKGSVAEARRRAAMAIWFGRGRGSAGSGGGDKAELYRRMIHLIARGKCGTEGAVFEDWSPLRKDSQLKAYASLWCFVMLWPHTSRYPSPWAYRGRDWPGPLQRWVCSVRRDKVEPIEAFERKVSAWCQGGSSAGPPARDRRAEAYLVHYLLTKDARSLMRAVRSFAFGNPEYSLAVALAEGK